MPNLFDVNQLSTSDNRRYSHEDCGLAVAASMAFDAGHPQVVAAMENWYDAHGDSPVDGTGCAINAAFLRSIGIAAVSEAGSLNDVDALLSEGHRVGLAIWSNHYGNPYTGVGRIGHFIEIAWKDGDSYHCMQPVGGYEVDYTHQQLVTASQGAFFASMFDYRQAGTTIVQGHSSGGTEMTNPQDVAAIVDLAYDVLAMRKALERANISIEPHIFHEDVDQATDFNNQVNAVVSGHLNLHEVINNITRA